MNKKSLAFLVLFVSLTLSGCGFSESSELMSDARKFIENGEYNKAMSNLSKVLDDDESNTEARGMYYQAMKLQKAHFFHVRHNYEQEIKELQDILNDNSGSAKIRSQAEDSLEKAQDSFQKQKKAVLVRKENAKKTAEENKNKYADKYYYGSKYKQEDDKDKEDSKTEVDKKNVTDVNTQAGNSDSSNKNTSGSGGSGSDSSSIDAETIIGEKSNNDN